MAGLLGDELLTCIAAAIDVRDLGRLALVCSRFGTRHILPAVAEASAGEGPRSIVDEAARLILKREPRVRVAPL